LADSITGDDNANQLTGNGGGDTIHGGGGNDSITGGVGNNKLYGDDGHDFLVADPTLSSPGSSNYLNGGAGNDGLIAGRGNDTLYGDDPTGDFNLDGKADQADYNIWRSEFGSSGTNLSADANGDGKVDTADYLLWRRNSENVANAGDDSLLLGGGTDTAYGGGGVDAFDFGSFFTVGSDKAVILDFHPNTDGDILDLSGLLPGYNPATSAIGDFLAVAQQGPDTLLKVDADGPGTGATFQVVAQLVNTQATSVDPAALLASGHLFVYDAEAAGADTDVVGQAVPDDSSSSNDVRLPLAKLEFVPVGANSTFSQRTGIVDAAFAESAITGDRVVPDTELLSLVVSDQAGLSARSNATALSVAFDDAHIDSSEVDASIGEPIGLGIRDSIQW
ncbi:MAG TPA: type I secretion C-terminal target domain-containing protein, partial [Lacipirellulaceae bacterium]|nr:type I secretion C-terminal target domain-containing protein [Lacipirellulaceae bacterium]